MKNLRYNFQSYSVGVGSAAAKNKLLAHLVLATSLKEHQISAWYVTLFRNCKGRKKTKFFF